MKKNKGSLLNNTFFYILPVQMVSGILLFLHSLVDSVLVGQFLGENDLAVIGLAVPIGLFVTLIGCIIANGFQILCGNAVGRGETQNVHAAFSNAVMLSVITGLIALGLCLLFSDFIAKWVGINDALLQKDFTDYLTGMSLGLPFAVFFQSLLSFLKLDGVRWCTILSTLVMIASKIIFDLVSIFLLQNGMFGIGLATSLSYCTAVMIGLICFFFKCRSFCFRIKSVSADVSLKLSVKGIPDGLQILSVVVFSSVLNSLAMRYGGVSGVSVLTMAINSSELLLGIVTASFATAALITTVLAGSRDYNSIKKIIAVSIVCSWILTAASCVLLIFAADSIAYIFGLEGDSAAMASHAMWLFVFCGFTCWGKLLTLYIYKSLGMVRLASIWCVITLIIIPCVSSIVLCALFGLDGLWYSYLVENTVSMIVALVFCSVKRKRLPHSIGEFIFLPDESGLSMLQLEMMMNGADDVVKVSEKIVAYCKDNGIDSRRGFFSGLCVEELICNIIQHNGVQSEKITVQLRALVEDNKLRITLCDNGRKFNPQEYQEMMDGTDSVDNIGMKIISGIAENIQYSAPFGLNMLFFEI